MRGITGETEGLEAARRAREEDKLKATLARLSGGRGGDYTSKKLAFYSLEKFGPLFDCLMMFNGVKWCLMVI